MNDFLMRIIDTTMILCSFLYCGAGVITDTPALSKMLRWRAHFADTILSFQIQYGMFKNRGCSTVTTLGLLITPCPGLKST